MQPVRIVGDKHGFIPALEEMPGKRVATVNMGCVGGVEPLHGKAQIALRGAEEKMIMVGHEAKGKNPDSEAGAGASCQIKKIPPVRIIKENILTPVTPGGNMIYRIRILYSPRPRHIKYISQNILAVKLKCKMKH
jgi:hypothetical protein